MLLTKFYNNVPRIAIFYLSKQTSFTSANLYLNCCKHSRARLLRTALSASLSKRRSYSNDSQSFVKLPALTDDPKILWPSFFKTLSNFIQCNFIIRPYMDQEFNLPEFIEGSKQALSVVSSALSREDYESIGSLVTADAINKVRDKISSLSPEQKQLIAVHKEDVYLSYPYQVGIMFNNETAHKRFVEITVVFHSLRGLSRMRAENKEPPINMGLLEEYQRLMFICNYRFVMELTKGVESSWTINMINHFMPAYID